MAGRKISRAKAAAVVGAEVMGQDCGCLQGT